MVYGSLDVLDIYILLDDESNYVNEGNIGRKVFGRGIYVYVGDTDAHDMSPRFKISNKPFGDDSKDAKRAEIVFDDQLRPVIKDGELDKTMKKYALNIGFRYRTLFDDNAKHPDEFDKNELHDVIVDDLINKVHANKNMPINGEMLYDYHTKERSYIPEDQVKGKKGYKL